MNQSIKKLARRNCGKEAVKYNLKINFQLQRFHFRNANPSQLVELKFIFNIKHQNGISHTEL